MRRPCAVAVALGGALGLLAGDVAVAAFRPPSTTVARPATRLAFFGGAPKDDGSPGDYLCKDCGYVFTKGPAAWAKLPDSYGCPPCGSPKFRFKKVPKGSASGKVVAGGGGGAKKKGWF